MGRRSDPELIDQARHAGTKNRLMGSGLDEATSDAWIAAWDAQATKDGLERGAANWDAGWRWIEVDRAARRPPS
jgi:hypothetical protein